MVRRRRLPPRRDPGALAPAAHEGDGPRLLHGFEFALLTDGPAVPQVEHLAAIPAGSAPSSSSCRCAMPATSCPSWDELVRSPQACRERGVPLHLDGARIWESAPHLGHALAEMAALADSVYVSLYKGLGGLAGAAVAGPEDEVAEARRLAQAGWAARCSA